MTAPGHHPKLTQRGTALLVVLWLVAATSAVALSLATSVRAELERATAHAEGVRAYYLARGALYRAILYVMWGFTYRAADGTPLYYSWTRPNFQLEFPSGIATVEVIPERAKLNLNTASAEELVRLLVAVGVQPPQAEEIAAAIIDWRSPTPDGRPSDFDLFYATLRPSFLARHASFESEEELLLVKGMTPELFYGHYQRLEDGSYRWIPGLRDCLSVYGSSGGIDANTAPAPVLLAIGLSPAAVDAILQRRAVAPFRSIEELRDLVREPAASRLTLGGNSMYTIRVQARLRMPDGSLSETQRGVAALIKLLPPGSPEAFHVLRWYDNSWQP